MSLHYLQLVADEKACS